MRLQLVFSATAALRILTVINGRDREFTIIPQDAIRTLIDFVPRSVASGIVPFEVCINCSSFGKQKTETTATAGSDVVPSGRPIFDDFFQHLWPYIGNNTANVVFQRVKRLWLIRIDP
ncbi:hypothetical protein TNCV_1810141 [Trichonephila clavipes]|nr:hypothetical protein TNCV_1810141 [Trichonephila clavipes]